MTVTADWHWWTHFVVGAEVVNGGCVIDYDMVHRRVCYHKRTGRDYASNPCPRGTPEYEAWLYDIVDAEYDRIWVDPQRGLHLPHGAFEALRRAEKPVDFIELEDRDPQDYFGGTTEIVSTYLLGRPPDDS